MSEENNRYIAHLWYEVMWSEPRPEVAEEIVHPDYAPKWIHIDKKGPEQIRHEIRYFRSVFPDLKYRIVESTALRDRVWIRYIAKGTQVGPAWGFPPTGKTVEFEGASILYTSGGKVVDRWGAFSFYDILADLGSVPPLWELHKFLEGKP